MSEKFAFIAAEKASKTHPPVTKMCVWLQVSTSGFYYYNNAVESDRVRPGLGCSQHVRVAFGSRSRQLRRPPRAPRPGPVPRPRGRVLRGEAHRPRRPNWA